jgi:hypothetical protein
MDISKIFYYEYNDKAKKVCMIATVAFYFFAITNLLIILSNVYTPLSPENAGLHMEYVEEDIMLWVVAIIFNILTCSKALNKSTKIRVKTLTITAKKNSKTYDLAKLQSYNVKKIWLARYKVILEFNDYQLKIYTNALNQLKPILDAIIKDNGV